MVAALSRLQSRLRKRTTDGAHASSGAPAAAAGSDPAIGRPWPEPEQAVGRWPLLPIPFAPELGPHEHHRSRLHPALQEEHKEGPQ